MKTRATERLGIALPIFTAQRAANRLRVAAQADVTTKQTARRGVSQAQAVLRVRPRALNHLGSKPPSPIVITQAGLGLPH